MPGLLIYGANGYTGSLIAREARGRGLQTVVAGRTGIAVVALAKKLGLKHRVFGLDDPAAIAAGLRGATAVLNCAGPFSHTARPLVDACLKTGVHYLDITGEIDVFEALAAQDGPARAAGVMLLPGVGFDVVPSDCLAAHLKRRLPTATSLVLALHGMGQASRGTRATVAEKLPAGGMIRHDGKLTRVPAAWRSRVIDFGHGPVHAVSIPWGDVSTAFHSTGIPNIEVYLAAPAGLRAAAYASRFFGWLLWLSPVRQALQYRARQGKPGPTAAERARGRSCVWGQVRDLAGRTAVSRLEGPEPYALTALAAVASAERVLAGAAIPGFQTPAKLFGPDFVLDLPGVTRTDLAGPSRAEIRRAVAVS